MKRFTKGAVYYVSECKKGRAIYKDQYDSDPNFKINGHDAMREYGILWNRPCILMTDVDFGSPYVTVLPLSSTAMSDGLEVSRPTIVVDHRTEGPVVGSRARAMHDTTTFAVLDRLMTVNTNDVFSLLGFIEPETMEHIDNCIKYILGYAQKPSEWVEFENRRNKWLNRVDGPEITDPELIHEEDVSTHDKDEHIEVHKITESIKSVVDTVQSVEDHDTKLSPPMYNVENLKALSVPIETKLPAALVKECCVDSRSFEIFQREEFNVGQYISIATIPAAMIASLLDISEGAGLQLRNSATVICERIIDFGKVIYPRNTFRKHKIIFALADHDFIRKSSTRLIAARYGVSTKKAAEFVDLANSIK